MPVRRIFLGMLVTALLLMLGACGTPAPEGEDGVPLEKLPADELPETVENWIELSQDEFAARTHKENGLLYILVCYGEKPTGGYSVEITSVELYEDRVVVTADFKAPGPDEMVIQVLTYPYALAVVEDPGVPVEFEATGAEDSIPVR